MLGTTWHRSVNVVLTTNLVPPYDLKLSATDRDRSWESFGTASQSTDVDTSGMHIPSISVQCKFWDSSPLHRTGNRWHGPFNLTGLTFALTPWPSLICQVQGAQVHGMPTIVCLTSLTRTISCQLKEGNYNNNGVRSCVSGKNSMQTTTYCKHVTFPECGNCLQKTWQQRYKHYTYCMCVCTPSQVSYMVALGSEELGGGGGGVPELWNDSECRRVKSKMQH